MPSTTSTGPAAGEADGRHGDDLINAAANGSPISTEEAGDLLTYYLTNDALPGDTEVTELTVALGHGHGVREFRCEVHTIEWAEWQDARERATDAKSGEFDAYISASWIVARALVSPKLGPAIARLQRDEPEKAPEDAAALLRRMFRRQSGALLELSAKVLELSKLQNNNATVREVEAGKP